MRPNAPYERFELSRHHPGKQPLNRVLVTGGAGFIGSHIVRFFCERGDEVVVLDDLHTGRRTNLEGLPVRWVEGSVLDPTVVESSMEGVDYVFHLAALISVAESMEHPLRCVDVNVRGTLNVLEAAPKAATRKVVFSSTAAVYGEEPSGARREDMCTHPISPYGVTRLDGELYLEMYRRHCTRPIIGLIS